MGFFQTFDQLDDIEKRIQENSSGPGKLFRFRLKPDEERTIIFLTDDPPIIDEHTVHLGGKRYENYTCLKNAGEECPLCAMGDKAAVTGFFVVLDRTEFTHKGKTYKNQVRVLAAKFKSLKQLKKFKQKYKGLALLEFDVSRTDDKAAAIGDVWSKNDKLDRADVEAMLSYTNKEGKVVTRKIEDVIPEWEEYLALKPKEELLKVTSGKGADLDDDEEVSF
jgi:hypothetical protein